MAGGNGSAPIPTLTVGWFILDMTVCQSTPRIEYSESHRGTSRVSGIRKGGGERGGGGGKGGVTSDNPRTGLKAPKVVALAFSPYRMVSLAAAGERLGIGLSWKDAVCLSKAHIRIDLATSMCTATALKPRLLAATQNQLSDHDHSLRVWEFEMCNYGGELILCDSCSRGFHAACLGVDSSNVLPDTWYCKECASVQQLEARRGCSNSRISCGGRSGGGSGNRSTKRSKGRF